MDRCFSYHDARLICEAVNRLPLHLQLEEAAERPALHHMAHDDGQLCSDSVEVRSILSQLSPERVAESGEK